jgi:hypothetical protein
VVVNPASDSNTTINVDINSAIEDAVAKVSPAVVTVVNYAGGQAQGSGSGVITSADGFIVTNNHVVEGSTRLEVIFQDGSTADAELIGTDEFVDVAVIKVNDPVPAYAEFGNSDALNPGEAVIAIGSPLGDFRNTVTVGVVSATGRSLDTSANYQMEGLIQTDAAINHGNSGGPLVNLAGQVVGINTLVIRGSGTSSDQAEGIGFAVASNIVSAAAQQLMDQGYVARPYLGIEWSSITPQQGSAVQPAGRVGGVCADRLRRQPGRRRRPRSRRHHHRHRWSQPERGRQLRQHPVDARGRRHHQPDHPARERRRDRQRDPGRAAPVLTSLPAPTPPGMGHSSSSPPGLLAQTGRRCLKRYNASRCAACSPSC